MAAPQDRDDRDPETGLPVGWDRHRYTAPDSSWALTEHGEEETHRPPWGPGTAWGTADAARLGLDRNTVQGAEIAFFSHLRADKRSHKVVAWVALLAFSLPVLLTLFRVVAAIGGFLAE